MLLSINSLINIKNIKIRIFMKALLFINKLLKRSAFIVFIFTTQNKINKNN